METVIQDGLESDVKDLPYFTHEMNWQHTDSWRHY